jgi:hypothetical protein
MKRIYLLRDGLSIDFKPNGKAFIDLLDRDVIIRDEGQENGYRYFLHPYYHNQLKNLFKDLK